MPTFQRRHYEMIARCLHTSYKDQYVSLGALTRLARMFKEDNPSFKPERFVKACGRTVKDEK